MTAVLVSPPDDGTAPPAAGRRSRLLVAVLVLAAALLLALAGFRAAEASLRLGPVTPAFGGSAPTVTLPTYGAQGVHVVGYEHGATARISLPIQNRGLLPLTITSVDLRGGVAPLLVVQEVAGLPLSLDPGETATVEVIAELANCRFFHEREIQNYAGFDVDVSLLGRKSTRAVAYDRPLMVHSPMIVGCPERQLNRQADNRRDLTGAA